MSRAELVVLSAHTERSLVALAGRWRARLLEAPALPLSEVAAHAAREQRHLGARLAIVARSTEELAAALASPRPSRAAAAPRLAWVFSGGGAQWPGMGLGLAQELPAFDAALRECDALFQRELGWSVLGELGGARLEEIEVFHATLFSVQVALAAEWRALGVAPSVVVGHSLGELAAAYAAGALSLEDAVRVVARRGRLQGSSPRTGTAAVVGLSFEEAERAIARHAERVSVGASNAPRMTMISGASAPLEELVAELSAQGVFCRFIKGAKVAPHSPEMEPLLPALVSALEGLSPRAGHTPILSTVDLSRSDGRGMDARYWARNLRQPVRFSQAIARLLPEVDRFLELSAHPVLGPAIEEQGGRALFAMKRDHDPRETFLSAVGALYTAGATIALDALYGPPARALELPVLEPPAAPPAPAPAPPPAPSGPLSPVHEALLALDAMQEELDRARAEAHEPIAIVSMACRFPGGADSPEALWSLLEEGADAVREIPTDRFDPTPWYDPKGGPGKMQTKQGGFLDTAAVSGFDPLFFGISPREAMVMDPQQRLLLELAHEVLERAGLSPAALSGSKTGVFAGVCSGDYYHGLSQHADAFDGYAMTGNIHSFAVGRIAYVFDLAGPSMVVDTACSSSLVAVHLAVKALRTRECDLALAGGVNLILSPASMIFTSVMNALAPDGRAKAFDARADGTNRGEGCGMVLLERLSDARARGHTVLAVLRGTALNHDGRSNGMTAPSVHAQAAVIRAALEDGGLRPEEVELIEAHGTGTKLGDPIEVEALKAVYGPPVADGRALHVSALKTNVGHMEAAAGIGGLIKAVLSLSKAAIPPLLHFRELNPHIDLSGTRITMPRELTPWPRRGLRRAAVSAFGASGTNAHVVLEEAPEDAPRPPPGDGPYLVTVSAKSAAALASRVAALVAAIERERPRLDDLAFTTNVGRAHHGHRIAVVAASLEEAAGRLRAASASAPPASPPRPHVRGASPELLERLCELGIEHDPAGDLELDGRAPLAELLAEVYRAGLTPRFERHERGRAIFLPTYPFERRRQWAPILDAPPERGFRPPPPGLAGARVPLAGLALEVYERTIAADAPGYLSHHRLFDTAVLPATAHLELMLAATGPARLEDVRFDEAVTLPESGARPLQVQLGAPEASGARRVEVFAGSGGDWVRASSATARRSRAPLEAPTPRGSGEAVDMEAWYLALRALGFEFGHDFRVLSGVVAGQGEASGEVALPPHLSADGYLLHPVLLDGCLQLAGPAFSSLGKGPSPYVPIGVDAIDARGPLGARARAVARVAEAGAEPKIDLWIWGEGGALAVVVRGLRLRKLSSRAALGLGASGLLDWLYRVEWEPAPLTPAEARPGRWLLVGDAPELPGTIRAAWGPRYAREGDRATIRRDHPEDLARLYTELDGVAGVALVEVGLRHAYELLRAHRTPTVLFTRGALSGDAEVALLWGFGRALAAERPGLVRLVELGSEGGAAELGAELGAADPEVSYLDGAERRVSRLTRVPRAAIAPAPVRFDPEGSYLVLGGLGAVGFEMARRMVAAGARHLVLAGRSSPPPALDAALAELSRKAHVRVVALDVAAPGALAALVRELLDAPAPLRGVLHSAGLTADGTLEGLAWDAFDRVMAPKVAGSRALLEAIGDRALDFVAFFASGASMLGSPGQTNYAAANAYQDALAQAWAGRATRVVSIDWGPWTEVGGSERRELEERWARRGVHAIAPEAGFTILEHLLAGAPAQVAVLPIDWAVFAERWPDAKSTPIFSRLVGSASAPIARELPILDALRSAAPEARHGLIVRHVSGIVARVLCVEPSVVDARAPLSSLGMDSLVALQVKHKIETELGVRVPVVELLRGAPIEELARHLDPAGASPAPPPAPAAPVMQATEAAELLERVDELSDAEVGAQLARLLAEK